MIFWKTDLLLWPCSKSKDGKSRTRPQQSVTDFLDDTAADVLRRARKLAFECPGTKRGPSSPLVASLDRYDGHLCDTRGFRAFISSLLAEGTLCLTISGGLGFVHPYEPIRDYEASMDKTAPTVWREILPHVLANLVRRNDITRVFIACSEKYDSVLWKAGRNLIWARYVEEVFRFVPHLQQQKGVNTNTANPALVAKTILELQDLKRPDSRWEHWTNPHRR